MTRQEILDYWKRETNVVWDELRQQHDLPIPVPRADRDKVDEIFRDDVKGACEADLPGLLADYRKEAEGKAESLARFYQQWRAKVGQSRIRRRPSPARQEEARNAYQRFSDERYMRILAFVSQREVPFRRLLERSFSTAGRRISWDRVAAEWNRANPRDPLNATTLKRYYYRGRYQKRLRKTYFDRLFKEWFAGPSAHRVWLEAVGHRNEDLFVRSEDRFVSDDVLDDLRKLSERYASDPEHKEGFRKLFESFNRHRKARAWVPSVKYPPKVAAAHDKARKAKCVLLAMTLNFPKDTKFCRRRDCRRCPVYRALKRASILRLKSKVLQTPQRLAELRAERERQFREQFRFTQREKAAPTPGTRSPNAKRTTPSRRSRS